MTQNGSVDGDLNTVSAFTHYEHTVVAGGVAGCVAKTITGRVLLITYHNLIYPALVDAQPPIIFDH